MKKSRARPHPEFRFRKSEPLNGRPGALPRTRNRPPVVRKVEKLRRVARGLLGTTAALLFLFSMAEATSEKTGTEVAVLLSHRVQPYEQALAGFQQHLRERETSGPIQVHHLGEEVGRDAQAADSIAREPPRVLLTVGSPAARLAAERLSHIPMVAGMILSPEDVKAHPDATAVVLDIPLEVQLAWLTRVLPGCRNVGVLYHTESNERKVETAGVLADRMGLRLYARKVQSPSEIPDALGFLSKRADVLWGLPDSLVVTPQTAKPLLLFSFRNNIPFVGLSSSWTKAGSLYSLDCSYPDIGVQCAEVVLKVLRGTPPRSIPRVHPRKVLLSLNLKTAQHMRLHIPEPVVRSSEQVFE